MSFFLTFSISISATCGTVFKTLCPKEGHVSRNPLYRDIVCPRSSPFLIQFANKQTDSNINIARSEHGEDTSCKFRQSFTRGLDCEELRDRYTGPPRGTAKELDYPCPEGHRKMWGSRPSHMLENTLFRGVLSNPWHLSSPVDSFRVTLFVFAFFLKLNKNELNVSEFLKFRD